jgi:hypothetical protein
VNLESKQEKMKPLLVLIEKILDDKVLTGGHRKDEFQKIFSCIIQDVDIVNTFERRKAGVNDEEWDSAVKLFNEGLEKKDED